MLVVGFAPIIIPPVGEGLRQGRTGLQHHRLSDLPGFPALAGMETDQKIQSSRFLFISKPAH